MKKVNVRLLPIMVLISVLIVATSQAYEGKNDLINTQTNLTSHSGYSCNDDPACDAINKFSQATRSSISSNLFNSWYGCNDDPDSDTNNDSSQAIPSNQLGNLCVQLW